MLGITLNDVIGFIITYKWWLIALSPFAIGIMIVKVRG